MDILNEIGEIVIPGVLVVFLALVILIFAVWLMGRVLSTNKKKNTPTPQASKQAAAPAKANAPVAKAAPTINPGISGETVAAISAAVACCMETSAPGVSYAIRSIGRPRESRPVWGFAGMQQNTRPF